MAAPIFLHHVVGDLTLGKPDLVEFYDTETVEAAARAIATCSEGAITVWRRKRTHGGSGTHMPQPEESRASRFVGMLNSLDVVAFIASVGDHDLALRAPVSEVVRPDSSLLKEVDPGTRLVDALEMMKQGVKRLLVRKSTAWRGMSKRFSVIYNGKWLKNIEASVATTGSNQPSSSKESGRFCCLSREDVARFLIGCLGALAPIPLSSISVLGAISQHYSVIEASSSAIEAATVSPQDPSAVAVVETNPDGSYKIIGEISSYKLWKCDHLAAAWAMANLSAGQFVMGAEDNNSSPVSLPDFSFMPQAEDAAALGIFSRPRKFSSRSIGFFSKPASPTVGGLMNMYRGRSAPLTCKHTSSLAAVMAQMLSHRATHVWVINAGSDDTLVGVVSYVDILHAVTKNRSSINMITTCEF